MFFKYFAFFQVKISWPVHVVFLQPPILCRWDEEKKNWTKSHIHNAIYDTQVNTVSFRTGIFGIYAFATLRYSHLPYKDWRIRPDNEDSVTILILSSVLKFTFNIKGNEISLVAIENSPTDVLHGIIGKYFKLNRLKRHLKQAGIDIFPGTV